MMDTLIIAGAFLAGGILACIALAAIVIVAKNSFRPPNW